MRAGNSPDNHLPDGWAEENDPVWRLLAKAPVPEPDAWFTVRTLARCRYTGLAAESPRLRLGPSLALVVGKRVGRLPDAAAHDAPFAPPITCRPQTRKMCRRRSASWPPLIPIRIHPLLPLPPHGRIPPFRRCRIPLGALSGVDLSLTGRSGACGHEFRARCGGAFHSRTGFE